MKMAENLVFRFDVIDTQAYPGLEAEAWARSIAETYLKWFV
jgi:hypothetical protein